MEFKTPGQEEREWRGIPTGTRKSMYSQNSSFSAFGSKFNKFLNKQSYDDDQETTILEEYRQQRLLEIILTPGEVEGRESPSWPSSRSQPKTSPTQNSFHWESQLPSTTFLERLSPIPFAQDSLSVDESADDSGGQWSADDSGGQFCNAPLISNQLSLLQYQLERKEFELDCARQAEIEIRRSNLELQDRVGELEATLAVLESRFEASARREIELNGMVKNTAVSVVVDPPPSLPVTVLVQDPELLDRVQLLKTELNTAKSDRLEAEESRAAAEKALMAFETRLEYAKEENKKWQGKVVGLRSELERGRTQHHVTEEENNRLRLALKDLKVTKQEHEVRVSVSQGNYLVKKLVALVKDSMWDVDCLSHLVVNELSTEKKDMSVELLLDEPKYPDDLELFVDAFEGVKERARNAKLRAIEEFVVRASTTLLDVNKNGSDGTPPHDEKCGVQ